MVSNYSVNYLWTHGCAKKRTVARPPSSPRPIHPTRRHTSSWRGVRQAALARRSKDRSTLFPKIVVEES
jgi:hypothetical protein